MAELRVKKKTNNGEVEKTPPNYTFCRLISIPIRPAQIQIAASYSEAQLTTIAHYLDRRADMWENERRGMQPARVR